MLNRKIKTGTLTLIILALTSCNSNIPVLENKPEFGFETKDLTASYIVRKFQTWLNAVPVNGAAIVKEIAYARTKYPTLFITVMTDNPEILEDINEVQAVKDRITIDNAFKLFLESCEPIPFIGEFQVNTFTDSAQRNPDVAMDAAGDFVVTWQSIYQDGENFYSIYAQRYNSAGQASGTEFRVESYTLSKQTNPAVAMDADGDFVITWQSYDQDGSYAAIYARRYNSGGQSQGTEFQVNTYTTGAQYAPTVAMDADGDFVITWSSNYQDGDRSGVFARRYNSGGQAQGAEFQVNTFTTHNQYLSAVAMDSRGDFVVTWLRWVVDEGNDVNAQRYSSTGERVGSEFIVNTRIPGHQSWAAPAMDADGDFVITWTSNYQDGTRYGVFAQRYNSSGELLKPTGCGEVSFPLCNPATGEFQVNTYTTGEQSHSDIAMDNDGDFVISWMSSNQDGYDDGAFARRYARTGAPTGSEFQVNTYTTYSQNEIKTAMDADGDFVITWMSYGNDGYDNGIFAQRYNSSGSRD
jgi:hypothetical protein